MRMPELIVRTAREALTRDPELLGVRLSPVTLSANEAKELANLATREFGPSAFVVVSAPGVDPRLSKDRIFAAPDQRAAEQATAWRNVVNVKRGEHLVYVSCEEHDKAGGLRDCLIELTDDDLIRQLLSYCRDQGGILRHTADALEEAKLTDRMSPAMLSGFVDVAAKSVEGKKEKDAWAVIGETLPLLGLARDTKLARATASERLSENRRLVARAATGEVRRQGTGQVADIERQLREGLRQGEAAALASVDLGPLKLAKPQPKKRSTESARTEKPAPKKVARKQERVSTAEASDPATATASRPGAKSSGSAGRNVPRWPPAEALPSGLHDLLRELNASGGQAIECRSRVAARRTLKDLPSDAAVAHASVAWPENVAKIVDDLQDRRTALLALIDPDQTIATRVLIRLPSVVLKVPEVKAAVHTYLSTCLQFFQACATEPDEVLRGALERESIGFFDGARTELRLLGPLHPLWLAQSSDTAQLLANTPDRDDLELLRRVENMAAPATWPLGTADELAAADSEQSLLVFERAPSVASPKALEHVGYRIGRRFLELSPHARIGLRIAIVDGEPAALIEGLSRAAIDAGGDVVLTVVCDRPAELGPNAEQLLASSRLSVEGVPHVLWEARPHVVFRLSPRRQLPDHDEPGLIPGGSSTSSLLKTQFVLDGSGLRACVDISGVPVLRAFEEVHATLRRRRPTGLFTHDLRLTPLSAALPTVGASSAVWHVAVGPGLGRRAPMDYKTLVYELVDRAAVVAVVSREVRPASRAVADGLVRAGLTEDNESFRTVSALTSRLAQGSGGGVLSLELGTERLIAAGLLGLELERRGAAVIGRPEGPQYVGLLGEMATDSSGALAIALSTGAKGALAVTVGYSTLDQAADIKTNRGTLGGAVGDRVRRVLSVLRLARNDTPAGTAALELLSWVLFPAIAANIERGQQFVKELAEWREGAEPDLSVLLLAPSSASGNGKALELAGAPVSVVQLNTDLFNRLVIAG